MPFFGFGRRDRFFVTTLEEDDFSPLKLKSKKIEEDVLKLKSNLREEDVLKSREEEDVDSN
jgi:hypothetical protein